MTLHTTQPTSINAVARFSAASCWHFVSSSLTSRDFGISVAARLKFFFAAPNCDSAMHACPLLYHALPLFSSSLIA